MIPKRVVNAFLARPLESYEWMKELPERELDKAIKEIGYKFKTEPYKHQKASFLIGVHNPRFLYFLDMGTGKTKIVLDVLAYLKSKQQLSTGLIMVPNVVNIDNWEEQIAEHAPSLDYIPMYGSTEDRWELLDRNPDLFILNYAGLIHLVCEKADVKVKERAKKENKKVPGMKMNLSKVMALKNKVNSLALDEIQLLKNHNSLSYKVCNKLTSYMDYQYGMTGTPFGRDPQDLWAQFHAIDKGATLGPTLGIFREAFFNVKKGYWGGFEYSLKKANEKLLHKTLQNMSIRYSADECHDLPPLSRISIHVKTSAEILPYYQKAAREIRESKSHKIIDNAFMRARQLTSGFLNFKDEDGKSHSVVFDENPKLEALMELVDAMPSDCKLVIINEFILSGDFICKELDKRKIKYVRLWSGTKDPVASIKSFKNNKDVRIAVANWQSIAEGVNMQVANYLAVYESPVSPIKRQQTEKRVYRGGQKKKVFLYDFLVKDSVDESIMKWHAEGKSYFDALIEGKASINETL